MRGERWKGCWEELKVVGVAEGAVKRITRTLQCASSAWLSGFQFFSFSGGYGGKPRQTSFGMKKTRRAFHRTAASGKHKSADLRAILRVYLAAALGSVVAWIGDSCSGYAGFRPCLLSNGGCLSLSLARSLALQQCMNHGSPPGHAGALRYFFRFAGARLEARSQGKCDSWMGTACRQFLPFNIEMCFKNRPSIACF